MKISDATKILVKKGNPLGSDFIDYSVLVHAEKDFYVKKISIENNASDLDFYYKNLETGESSHKMLQPFQKGSYSFNFRINDVEKISEEEYLIFEYTIANQTSRKRIPITINKQTILTR